MHPENNKILNQQSVAMSQSRLSALSGHNQTRLSQIFSVLPSGTPAVATPPHPPDRVDFPAITYVSFRLAASLPSTHPWGGYIPNDFLSAAEAQLVANGCAAHHAASIATDVIRAHISHQYLLDRACLNLHELLFMSGAGPRFNEVIDAVCYYGHSEAGPIGVAKAHSAVSELFGAQSAEAQAVSATFDTGWNPRGKLAKLCRHVFCDLLADARLPFLGPDGPYGVARFLPVYTNEDKCFPGIELPISHY